MKIVRAVYQMIMLISVYKSKDYQCFCFPLKSSLRKDL